MTFQRRLLLLSTFAAFVLSAFILNAQDPQRFQKEVDSIVALNRSVSKSNLIVFTGSSSIRLWHNLKASFPNHNVVNLGFGGSEMTDLLYFTDQLILPFRPVQIFIYEGDNDISFGRTVEQIMEAAGAIVNRVQQQLPTSEVIFISPKPSLARWELKDDYELLNKKLEAWVKGKKNVKYVDVWTPMLDQQGNVRKDIFVKDGLHLNEKGYLIWGNIIKKYLTN